MAWSQSSLVDRAPASDVSSVILCGKLPVLELTHGFCRLSTATRLVQALYHHAICSTVLSCRVYATCYVHPESCRSVQSTVDFRGHANKWVLSNIGCKVQLVGSSS